MAHQLAFLQDAYPTYTRRRPEDTVLYQVILEHWETFRSLTDLHGGLPKHVTREFEAFLGCGILAKGFFRLRCDSCKSEQLLAFSCKKRGFCPSCGGRRMAETAALLVDETLPHAPYRQWVLSFPFPLRYLLARRPDLLSVCLTVAHRAIGTWYKRQAKKLGISDNLKVGALTFIQRFGSSLNLNPHFHTLFMDGAVQIAGHQAKFRRVQVPTDIDVANLVATIAKRIFRALAHRGFSFKETDHDDLEQLELYPQLCAASVSGLSILDPKAPCKIGQLPFLRNIPWDLYGKQCASSAGFSLHAATSVKAHQRDKLEKLLRYLARPSLSNGRLAWSNDNNEVILKLKKPFRDGTTHIRFAPLVFLEKLAALAPPPRAHLVRYSGILGPHDAHRSLIVKNNKKAKTTNSQAYNNKEDDSDFAKKRRLSWAKLLARVFHIDVTTCNHCGGNIRILAAITQQRVIEKILNHLNLPTWAPSPSLARPPPQQDFDFDQRF